MNSMNSMFFLKIVVFLITIQLIRCNCGQPGKPFESNIWRYNSSGVDTVQYTCSFGFERFYEEHRYCVRGEWTGRVPKCGKY
jgi:hypothetical protein